MKGRSLTRNSAGSPLARGSQSSALQRTATAARNESPGRTALVEKLQLVVKEPEFKQDLRNMILTYVGDVASKEEFRRSLGKKAEARLVA